MILDESLEESYIQSLPRLSYSYIETLQKEILTEHNSEQTTSPYVLQEINPSPENFPDIKCYNLFFSSIEKLGKSHSDISYLYRIMFADKFIHQLSESQFRNWLEKKQVAVLKSKLQQLSHTESKKRKALYLSELKSYQLDSVIYSKSVSK
jgi:hypothetical protein